MRLSKSRFVRAAASTAIAVFVAAVQSGCATADDKIVQDAAAMQHQQMGQMGKQAGQGGSQAGAPAKGMANMSSAIDKAGKAGPGSH